MSHQHSQSGIESNVDHSGNIHKIGTQSAVHALRRPAASITALTLGIVVVGGLGVSAMRVDASRRAHALDSLSAMWTHLLSLTHIRALPEYAGDAVLPGFGTIPAVTAVVVAPSAQQSVIVYGDRLKITFFESVRISVDDPAQKSGSSPLTTMFPRMDLSGEYTVDEAGNVDVPRLGRLLVAGHDVNAIELQLGSAFQRVLGRPSDVYVAILDRQPVYVLGGPRGGATIKHAPGMIVLQALAEAGGAQRTAWDASRTVETIRETQRLGEVQDRLAHALVRRAQLIALRDGHPAVELPSETATQLIQMLPQDAIAALRQEADTTLEMERQAHAEQLDLADRLVSIAKGELAAQNLRVTQARVITQNRATRLRDLQGIAAHGSVSQFKVADAAAEVAEGTAKQEDLLVAVAQAETRLAEAEIAQAKVVQAHTKQVAANLAANAQDVRDLRRSVASMKAVVEVLGEGQQAGTEGNAASRSLRIVRRGTDGTRFISATGTTPLMPGDVLQIDAADPAS